MQCCPTNCIKIEPDQQGFLYPVVGESCIQCGKCVRICPAVSKVELGPNSKQRCLMVHAIDKKIEKESASGGFCAAIANYYIQNKNAVVFACVMDENFLVLHQAISKQTDIYKFQGSKYVQSDTKNTFQEAEKLLLEGRYVLYMATPCQIAGLKSYLNRDYERLVTVDLICHGVPSNQSFQEYILYLLEKTGEKIISYRFRNKNMYDKSGFRSKTVFQSGKTVILSSLEDIYFYLFSQGKIYRESCYQCKYACKERQGDFTCGDCGSRASYPDFAPYQATSTVILNTENAQKIWGEVSDQFLYRDISLDLEIQKNTQLHICVSKPEDWQLIYDAIFEKRWDWLKKNYLPTQEKKSIPGWVSAHIPIFCKLPIKKIILLINKNKEP